MQTATAKKAGWRSGAEGLESLKVAGVMMEINIESRNIGRVIVVRDKVE